MIQQRKNEVMVLLENKEIQERLCALCGNEANKDKFKASLLNIALDSKSATMQYAKHCKSKFRYSRVKAKSK